MAMGVISALVWTGGLIDFLSSYDLNVWRQVLGTVVLGGITTVSLYGGWRFGRTGVLAGPDDVIVRNPAHSRRVAWVDIDSFSVERLGLWTGGAVNLRNGEKVAIFGIQGQPTALFPNGRWAKDPIDGLNARLTEVRNAPDQPDAGSPMPQLPRSL